MLSNLFAYITSFAHAVLQSHDFFNQSLWLDEATSILVARDFSVSGILTKFSPGDFHPPLYYILLKVWLSVFGSSEFAARSLSLVFSGFSVVLVYPIAKRLFNKFVAVGSSVLLATAPLLFYYSFEARMYSMSVFASLLVIFFFSRLLKDKQIKTNWIGFVLSSILLIYTDYLPSLTLVFCLLYLVGKRETLMENKSAWSISFLIISLAFIPWLPTFLRQLEVGAAVRENAPIWWETLGKTNLKQIALVPVKFLIGRISFDNNLLYLFVVSLFAFEFGISLVNSLKKYQESLFVWLWFLIPFVLTLIFGLVMSGFSYFRLLFLLPPFYLLVAHGISHSKQKAGKLSFRVGLNLLACLVLVLTPSLWKEDWKSAVKYVEENSKENAASVFVTNNQRDPYMYYSKSIPSGGPGILDSNPPNKIWFFRYVQPIFDPEEKTRAKIEQLGYTKIREHDFHGIVVWEYERKDADFN